MDTTFDAISQALQTYFDGLYHSDTSRLSQALHPQARYVCATLEPLINLSMAEYFAIVDKRPSPASRGEARHDTIRSIAVAGPNTAFAHVTCAIGEKHFTDYLTLIRDQGRWQIIAKVFHFDIEEEA